MLREVERDLLENGPRPGALFCNACGLCALERIVGEAYRRRCRACGFQGALKVEIMPDMDRGFASWSA